ncbi:hypothetical protein V3Q90_05305 [Flavobacterium oreochromis]|uniref:Uncharacterized protein n=1 Tax=Flavobacterium columnare TaxID=996 RepID=A0A8G0KWN3_9FLAO|nr:hypothetical protein [Flavobacterium davisii]QYS89134.1 hypothetical protein JJC05_01540 [Flavobacterium davisii]
MAKKIFKPFSKDLSCIVPSLEMENKRMDYKESCQRDLQKLWNEIYDMTLNLPLAQLHECHSKIRQLHQQVVRTPNESVNFEDDLSISFVFVENQLSQYISECLQGTPQQNINTQKIASLIRDYRVFQPLAQKKHSVSLERVHSILEDNFQDSSLTKLFDLLLKGSKDTQTKVITFF